MLSLRSIWRLVRLRLASDGGAHTRSFGTEVPQDDSSLQETLSRKTQPFRDAVLWP